MLVINCSRDSLNITHLLVRYAVIVPVLEGVGPGIPLDEAGVPLDEIGVPLDKVTIEVRLGAVVVGRLGAIVGSGKEIVDVGTVA